MSLSTVARPCCLKETRPDVFWRANMGFVIVFTQRPLMPEFCLVTAVSSTAGENNKTPFSPLPLFTWVPLTHTHCVECDLKQPLSCTLQHTCNHPQRGQDKAANKVLLDGGPVGKDGAHLKSRPFQSTARGAELDRKRNIHWVPLSAMRERHTPDT